mmetsp:Transcript_11194/g.25471  ORF Transcript_11194/g.25471 Transcript_11194/m.25471 type:complete len:124 (+) Transcript_11194:1272-1643(+)
MCSNKPGLNILVRGQSGDSTYKGSNVLLMPHCQQLLQNKDRETMTKVKAPTKSGHCLGQYIGERQIDLLVWVRNAPNTEDQVNAAERTLQIPLRRGNVWAIHYASCRWVHSNQPKRLSLATAV